MKKFAVAAVIAGTAVAGAFSLAPSAHAAPPAKIGCYIPTPGKFVDVSVTVNAVENTNPAPGVPMPWNCMQ